MDLVLVRTGVTESITTLMSELGVDQVGDLSKITDFQRFFENIALV